MRERIRFEMEMAATFPAPDQEQLDADRNEQVDRFLRREKGFAQWRVSELLKCGAVELIRGSSRTALTNETEKLKTGDKVDLKLPLSSVCQKAIDNMPLASYRDYAFANPAPKDDYERFVIRLLGLRPQTTILSDTSVDTLTSFKRALEKGDRITNPIRHLVLASHAARTGLLALPLMAGSTANVVTFEDLESAVKTKSLEIDPALFDPRPKDASGKIIPARVDFKGCNIGNPIARPFLDQLKKALGGRLTITAPKFFHSMKPIHHFTRRGRTITSRTLVEIWEFFSYEFVLFRTTSLANKTDAVAAYLAAAKVDPSIVRIDGSAVPQTDWERWIPRTLPAANNVGPVDVPVTSTLSTKANSTEGQFRYRKTFFLGKATHDISLPSDPGTDVLRKDEVKKRLLASDKRFDPSHAYPIYARTGFKSIDEFFDSFDWKFKWDNRKKVLTVSGTRHEYTVLAPIVNPTTNELFMNLFPIGGTPTINLPESDTRFFASV